ncbi:hypothetical protein [Magnetofaba australis]|uniref:Putative transferase hexapeptide repeat containing protein n=1 Tax=Magnetofaba australis IT-1 TaxID=1434232 RepID=A0A1Y2K4J2_9PROT|nr:hypothetical protein [Magnetofaba australis]OSM02054.1 putative transferase hexapeptide repeat containing protein [Magnetofaba australis IT-1]
MRLELPQPELVQLVKRQLTSLFIFDESREEAVLNAVMGPTLEKTEHCFSQIANKYYSRDGEAYFNPFHAGQYAIFLYYLCRQAFLDETPRSTLPDRIYYLNKCLNSVDLFYEIEMPKVFFLDHPAGSVLGRATYGERFAFSQGCTVGNNKGVFPVFGENIKMMSDSKVLGNCHIGNNVILAANTYIKDTDIPDNSIVFGSSPNLVIKPNKYKSLDFFLSPLPLEIVASIQN